MDTIKWIKLTGFKYQAWKGATPTKEIRQREVYVNPALIVTIEKQKLKTQVNNLVDIPEQIGSIVSAVNGNTYEDVRPPKELIAAISEL